MVSRIADPGLDAPDPALAMVIDLVCACVTLNDLDFMFAELCHVADRTWRVPVDAARALRFEWIDDFGAVNIRLE